MEKYIEINEGVKYIIVKEANGDSPNKGDFIEIKYKAFANDKEFESKDFFKFEVGRNLVVKGLDLACEVVKRGVIIELLVEPEYGYGRLGLEGKVLPNSSLKYEIEVIDFYSKTSFRYAQKLKEQAVELFKEKKFSNAISLFNNSLDLVDQLEFNDEIKAFKLTLQLNLGNCYYKTEKFQSSVDILKEYIKVNNKNPKAYYFKGLSNYKLCFLGNFMECYGEAKRDYLRLSELAAANDEGVIELRGKVDELATIVENNKNKEKKEEYTYGQSKKKMFKSGLYGDIEIKVKPKDIPSEINLSNPRVFIDIMYCSKTFRLEIELFADVVPKAAEQFRVLCTGEKEGQDGFEKFTLVGTKFFRVIKDFMMQGGDFESNNGQGGYSLYGKEFEDENFLLNHSKGGVLSLSNIGPNTNTSQFMITFSQCNWLNGKNVVFGTIRKGLEELKQFESEVLTDKNDQPLEEVIVVSSGEIFK